MIRARDPPTLLIAAYDVTVLHRAFCARLKCGANLPGLAAQRRQVLVTP